MRKTANDFQEEENFCEFTKKLQMAFKIILLFFITITNLQH